MSGNVRIISVSIYDASSNEEDVATFRAGRPAELTRYALLLESVTDSTHWTMVAGTAGEDGGERALIRETTVRDGDSAHDSQRGQSGR